MKNIYCRLYTKSGQTISEILSLEDKPLHKNKGLEALIHSKLEELVVRYSLIYEEEIVRATVGINNRYNIITKPNGMIEIIKEG